ncbi:3-ketoacyl-CoA reductase [Gautieria morchelliformis]|nr:3-ketoacyl-CoA reductase [Gautieria morchelliformis]
MLPAIAVRQYPWLTLSLALLGAISSAQLAFKVTRILLQIFVIPGKSLKTFGAKQGAWAVITGATDGIGREFSLQLGKAGFNVFLASRSTEKLNAFAAELESLGVQTKVQAIDFAKPDDPAWEHLASALIPLKVGILVNNVGKSHDMPTDFVEVPEQEMHDILHININSTLRITRIVLPGLIARKCGLILNLGSFVGSIPSPMLAPYSASKSFLCTWTQALGKEVESKGVTVQLLNTYFVVSSMSKIRRPSVAVPTPKIYVRAALSKIGVPGGALGKPYTSTPYWAHSLADAVLTGLNWPSLFMTYTLALHKDIRRRALKKRAKETAATKKE